MIAGLVAVALAAIAWGTTGAALVWLGTDGTEAAIVLGAERFLVAAPILLVLAVARGGWSRPTGWEFAAAGLAMASFQICYFSAVPRAGVAISALLSICSAPTFIAILARAILGERFTLGRGLALAAGTCGATLLVADGGARGGPNFLAGAALAVGAGFSYSLYAVLTKRALPRNDQFSLTALTFAIAALALVPFLVAMPLVAVDLARTAWPTVLYLGIVPTTAAYLLFSSGLRRIPASSAAIVGLLEPLTATLLGAIAFGERFGPLGLAGAALLLGAVGLTARDRGSDTVRPAP